MDKKTTDELTAILAAFSEQNPGHTLEIGGVTLDKAKASSPEQIEQIWETAEVMGNG